MSESVCERECVSESVRVCTERVCERVCVSLGEGMCLSMRVVPSSAQTYIHGERL